MRFRPDRYLIVNADDFGQSEGVNRGIIDAHENGIVTSASLMVRWPAAVAAAAYAREHPALSVGLHLDLGEWAQSADGWTPLYEVVDLQDAEAVRREVWQQLDTCRRLLGRDPTHLDSHQHVHRTWQVQPIVQQMAAELSVPLRGFSADVHYCGTFYGQSADGKTVPDALRAETLIRTMAALPAGITEIGCHPGYGDDLQSMYGVERAREVEVLLHPAMKVALQAGRLTLCSYHARPSIRASMARMAAPAPRRWTLGSLFGR
jgi:predicted glycoside hydrolase/deacetylase ChbG (UPF0249 family)